MMGYADLIKKLEMLPSDKRAKVFDFVNFLSKQCLPESNASDKEWTDAEFSDFSMHHALRGMADDPVNYTKDDLREIWK